MRLRTLGIGIIAANVLALTAWAHHSHGNYEMRQFTEFDGTVTEIYWINPHAWVYMEVEDELRLSYEMTATDPATLTAPARSRGEWMAVPGIEIQPFDMDCADNAYL